MQSSKSLRVLHIMSGFGGGISSFILNKLESMPYEKTQIVQDVATYDEVSQRFQQAVAKANGELFKLVNPKVHGWRQFRQSYLHCLQTRQYDVIHCHISGYRALPYHLLAKQLNVPRFYIHAHTVMATTSQRSQKLHRLSEQLINRTLSDSYLGCGIDAIRSTYGSNIQTQEMMEIPNSIQEQRFIYSKAKHQQIRQQERERLNLTANDYVIGQIARLHPIKNHWQTLKIAEEIKRQQLPYIILLAGEGALKETLEIEIKQRGLDNIVRLLGRVDPIEPFFAAIDTLILPSHYEGFPTVVVEAQASGVPTVMSDSITSEVDCQLGLVDSLSLNCSPKEWLSALERSFNCLIPTASERLERLRQYALINEESAQVYFEFLHQERMHFLMNDEWMPS